MPPKKRTAPQDEAAVSSDVKRAKPSASTTSTNSEESAKSSDSRGSKSKAKPSASLSSMNSVDSGKSSDSGGSKAKPSTSTTSRSSVESGKSSSNGGSKAKPGTSSTSKKSAGTGKSSGNGESSSTVKTIIVKGKAPVDPECQAHSTMHVFTEGADIYDVMLNQTNVGNNNNKFYIIQLLEDDKSKRYAVWNRWGRVGFRGQNSMTQCGPDLDQAKKLFCQKFQLKTKNEWSERKKFKKFAGKYDMLKMDYGSQKSSEEVSVPKNMKIPDSKLEARLQALIKLICDVKEMEDVVREMKYDAQKAPLGRLTPEQIKAGYAALKKIDACVEKKNFGSKLIEACNDFYTRIPHCFGMSTPPLIRSKDEVKLKIELLEALGDIEIAMRILQDRNASENPIDTHYKSLNCDLKLVDRSQPVFKDIEEYLSTTHAPTHTQYKMNILDVFEVSRDAESKDFIDVGNRKLLWHGSRLTNMVGILSQGLRIAPPEAPVTGYMFGKGIYFADMSTKSANYCFATKTKNVGLILLCEVSLGKTRELLDADYNAEKLIDGYHSVMGLGKIAPDAAKHRTWFTNYFLSCEYVDTHNPNRWSDFLRSSSNVACSFKPDGTVVPIGHPKDTNVNNPNGYTLNYNEYIVYNTRQVRMKYVVQVQFDFN